MNGVPTQYDVDAVAHFVQAAGDLKASPFFIEEQCELGVTYSDRITYRLPDPRVRDAMVIPFRRMWMQDEPANFERVCNILKRYFPNVRPTIDYFKDLCKRIRRSFLEPEFGSFGSEEFGISPGDLVDLWLNCRLAHAGATAAKGQLSRHDYEREAQRLGEARFEFLFLTACFHIGLCYINLLQFAEDVLANKWASEGLKPSFVFEDNLAYVGSRSCEDGIQLQRSTPGLTLSDDDLPSQLKLLRRRRVFSEINKLLKLLDMDNGKGVDRLQNSTDVQNLVTRAGFRCDVVEAVSDVEHAPQTKLPRIWDTISDDFSDLRLYPWRKGEVARFDVMIEMDQNAKVILEEQLANLKMELFNGNGQPIGQAAEAEYGPRNES